LGRGADLPQGGGGGLTDDGFLVLERIDECGHGGLRIRTQLSEPQGRSLADGPVVILQCPDECGDDGRRRPDLRERSGSMSADARLLVLECLDEWGHGVPGGRTANAESLRGVTTDIL